MGNQGKFVLHIDGKYGDQPISPNNFDIALLYEVLGHVKALLRQENSIESPTVLSDIRDGSFIGIFKTSIENAAKISAVLMLLSETMTLDAFEPTTSKAFEGFQDFAIKHNVSVGLSTTEDSDVVKITPTTNLYRTKDFWVDAEFYLNGKIVDAGGKEKSNIHIDTDRGLLTLKASKESILSIKENPLYKQYGVRVHAKQNLITGEIDKGSFRLIEFIDYHPIFDDSYLNSKIKKATPHWKDVDVDAFLKDVREGEYVG